MWKANVRANRQTFLHNIGSTKLKATRIETCICSSHICKCLQITFNASGACYTQLKILYFHNYCVLKALADGSAPSMTLTQW